MRFVTFLILGLIASMHVSANERELIASMVRDFQQIQSGASVKKRLALYENISSGYEQLVTDYASTDIGLDVLITGAYKGLDFKGMTSTYIEELSDYYGQVCKDSPSYPCLGFVMLDRGYETCQSSEINTAVRGAYFLRQSAQIFRSSAKENYVRVALNALRTCSSNQNGDIRGAIEYQTVAENIESGRKDQDFEKAIAAIQRIDSESIYRLLAVIDLTDAQGKLRGSKERLISTITERFGTNNELFRFASVHFWSAYIKSGGGVAPNDLIASSKYDCASSPSEFDTQKQNEILGEFVKGVRLSRAGQARQFDPDPRKVKSLSEYLLKMTCGDEEHLWEAKTYYLVKNEEQHLDEIETLGQDVTEQELVSFEVANFVNSESDLKTFLTNRNLQSHPLRDLWTSQKQLDNGDVCGAVKSLFKVPQTQIYSAVDYILSSPNFDPSMEYECGDEDLTLLLGSI